MSNEHPITPPLKLMQQWANKQDFPTFEDIATQAARWGADQELEACVEWLVAHGWFGSSNSGALCGLRAARRPKPPSLAEQALNTLGKKLVRFADPDGYDIIRTALERLQELEKGNE